MSQAERLKERQARVGILRNPVEISLPVHRPRDVWSRWPDLRSARRRANAKAEPQSTPDDAAIMRACAEVLRAPVSPAERKAMIRQRIGTAIRIVPVVAGSVWAISYLLGG